MHPPRSISLWSKIGKALIISELARELDSGCHQGAVLVWKVCELQQKINNNHNSWPWGVCGGGFCLRPCINRSECRAENTYICGGVWKWKTLLKRRIACVAPRWQGVKWKFIPFQWGFLSFLRAVWILPLRVMLFFSWVKHEASPVRTGKSNRAWHSSNLLGRSFFFVASHHGTKRGRPNVPEVREKKAIRKYLVEGWKEDERAVCVVCWGGATKEAASIYEMLHCWLPLPNPVAEGGHDG